jgi:hypothetical protein
VVCRMLESSSGELHVVSIRLTITLIFLDVVVFFWNSLATAPSFAIFFFRPKRVWGSWRLPRRNHSSTHSTT